MDGCEGQSEIDPASVAHDEGENQHKHEIETAGAESDEGQKFAGRGGGFHFVVGFFSPGTAGFAGFDQRENARASDEQQHQYGCEHNEHTGYLKIVVAQIDIVVAIITVAEAGATTVHDDGYGADKAGSGEYPGDNVEPKAATGTFYAVFVNIGRGWGRRSLDGERGCGCGQDACQFGAVAGLLPRGHTLTPHHSLGGDAIIGKLADLNGTALFALGGEIVVLHIF